MVDDESFVLKVFRKKTTNRMCVPPVPERPLHVVLTSDDLKNRPDLCAIDGALYDLHGFSRVRSHARTRTCKECGGKDICAHAQPLVAVPSRRIVSDVSNRH